MNTLMLNTMGLNIISDGLEHRINYPEYLRFCKESGLTICYKQVIGRMGILADTLLQITIIITFTVSK